MATLQLPFAYPKSDKIHFPGLNTVRFVAAMAVVVHHVEQFKFEAHLTTLWPNIWVIGLGRSAVSIFFVLSGFLITYLLLAEYGKAKDINIKGFYVRRILRIWPLYYLIVIWVFFVLPRLIHFGDYPEQLGNHFYRQLLLFLLILPNAYLVFYKPLLGASQLWSIGLEEQFYLIWPHFIKRFVNNLLLFLATIIVLKLMVFIGLYVLLSYGQRLGISVKGVAGLNVMLKIFDNLQVENVTLGGIAAYLYYHGWSQQNRFIRHRATKAITLALLVLLVGYRDFLLHGIVEAVVFSLLITQIACSPDYWSKREGRTLRYLGNTSYGIYMFHPTLTAVALLWLLKVPSLGPRPIIFSLLLYGITVTLTLMVSAVSYAYFESPFLRLKKKFAEVRSGGA